MSFKEIVVLIEVKEESENTYLHSVLFVNQQIWWLKIPMDYRRIALMKIIHPFRLYRKKVPKKRWVQLWLYVKRMSIHNVWELIGIRGQGMRVLGGLGPLCEEAQPLAYKYVPL
jgi:hypothetical protein